MVSSCHHPCSADGKCGHMVDPSCLALRLEEAAKSSRGYAGGCQLAQLHTLEGCVDLLLRSSTADARGVAFGSSHQTILGSGVSFCRNQHFHQISTAIRVRRPERGKYTSDLQSIPFQN